MRITLGQGGLGKINHPKQPNLATRQSAILGRILHIYPSQMQKFRRVDCKGFKKVSTEMMGYEHPDR